jgi:hypothetical protein
VIGLALHRRERARLHGIAGRPIGEERERRRHHVQGVAQLVREHGEELVLATIGLGESVRALTQLDVIEVRARHHADHGDQLVDVHRFRQRHARAGLEPLGTLAPARARRRRDDHACAVDRARAPHDLRRVDLEPTRAHHDEVGRLAAAQASQRGDGLRFRRHLEARVAQLLRDRVGSRLVGPHVENSLGPSTHGSRVLRGVSALGAASPQPINAGPARYRTRARGPDCPTTRAC